MKTKQADWRFVVWWIFVATLLFFIGKLLRFIYLNNIEDFYESQTLLNFIGAAAGLLLHWLVFRPYIKHKFQLLIFMGLGSIATSIVSSVFEHYYSSNFQSILREQSYAAAEEWSNSIYFGFGIAQIIILALIYSFFLWLVLRKEFYRAKWWLVADPLIYSIRFSIAFLFTKTIRFILNFFIPEGLEDTILNIFISNLDSMIMYKITDNIMYTLLGAACIGLFLLWMLQKPIPQENERKSDKEIEEIWKQKREQWVKLTK